MLTDTKLKNLKPREKLYKVTDRDGLYVAVQPSGSVSFRYDYRINGRRETLTIGRYGADGITLAEARDELNTAKRWWMQASRRLQQSATVSCKLRGGKFLRLYRRIYETRPPCR